MAGAEAGGRSGLDQILLGMERATLTRIIVRLRDPRLTPSERAELEFQKTQLENKLTPPANPRATTAPQATRPAAQAPIAPRTAPHEIGPTRPTVSTARSTTPSAPRPPTAATQPPTPSAPRNPNMTRRFDQQANQLRQSMLNWFAATEHIVTLSLQDCERLIAEGEELQIKTATLSIQATSVTDQDIVATLNRSFSTAYAILNRNLQIRLEALKHPTRKDPFKMSWAELDKVIVELNIDVYDHQGMKSTSAQDYKVQVYLAYQERAGGPSAGDPPETAAQRQERIDSVVWIQLREAENVNTNEPGKPTCTRPDLFPEMAARKMDRADLMRATTCHPVHGALVSRALRELVKKVADRSPTNPISYDILVSNIEGRAVLQKYIYDNYFPHAIGLFPANMPVAEKSAKARHVLELIFRLFTFFDLLTVAFAELQKQTKTVAHGTLKKGVPISDLDRVWLSRPDAAMVHRLQRYPQPSDWSGWWLTLMREVPPTYGRSTAGHQQLVQLRRFLLSYDECFFGTSGFTGPNGIPATSIDNPLFPDMLSYLTLESNELQRGMIIADRDKYDVALSGWMNMLKLAIGALPARITGDYILDSAPIEGNKETKGAIDYFISEAGKAKVFPGNHMRQALAPLLSLYVMRLFSRLSTNVTHRTYVYHEVLEKIKTACTDSSGLQGFELEALKAIDAIASTRYAAGVQADRVRARTAINLLDVQKIPLSNNVMDARYLRTQQRETYLRALFASKKKKAPAHKTVTWAKSKVDDMSQTEANRFWAMVDGNQPLDKPDVNELQGTMLRIEDK